MDNPSENEIIALAERSDFLQVIWINTNRIIRRYGKTRGILASNTMWLVI